MSALQCAKKLYLEMHSPELARPKRPSEQLRLDEGTAVGVLARTYFPGGKLVEETRKQDLAHNQTLEFLKDPSVPAIFEATFVLQNENLVVKVDILKRNKDNSWDIIEVKSSSSTKDEHRDDLSVQLWAAERSGLRIRKAFLRHLNKDCRYPDLSNLFKDDDQTEEVRNRVQKVEANLKDFHEFLSKAEAPEKIIGRQCEKPYECVFIDYCWKNIPEHSTLELYNYKKRTPTKYELYHRDYKLIRELPDEYPLTAFQMRQRRSILKNQEIIDDLKGLKKLISTLRAPVSFFDFETIAPAVPFIEGMSPYGKIPLQFSCHIERGENLEHFEFFASVGGQIDPRLECIQKLKECFKDTEGGSIVVYNASFETEVLRSLAKTFPKEAPFLQNLIDRFWDLEEVFQKHFYHHSFGGSASIKVVLPYFASDMHYSGLSVQDGDQAQGLLQQIFSPHRKDRPQAEVLEQIRKDLMAYCAHDTLAMVVILRSIRERIK